MHSQDIWGLIEKYYIFRGLHRPPLVIIFSESKLIGSAKKEESFLYLFTKINRDVSFLYRWQSMSE